MFQRETYVSGYKRCHAIDIHTQSLKIQFLRFKVHGEMRRQLQMIWYWINIYIYTYISNILSKISNSEIRDGCTYISLPLDVICCIIARRMGKEKRKVRQVWERDWDRDGNGDGEGHGLSQSVRLNYLIMSHYWALINPHPSPDVTARTRRRREAFIPSFCFLAPSFCPQLLIHFTFWFQSSHSIHPYFPAFIHLTRQYVILDLRSACRKVNITNKISLIFQVFLQCKLRIEQLLRTKQCLKTIKNHNSQISVWTFLKKFFQNQMICAMNIIQTC